MCFHCYINSPLVVGNTNCTSLCDILPGGKHKITTLRKWYRVRVAPGAPGVTKTSSRTAASAAFRVASLSGWPFRAASVLGAIIVFGATPPNAICASCMIQPAWSCCPSQHIFSCCMVTINPPKPEYFLGVHIFANRIHSHNFATVLAIPVSNGEGVLLLTLPFQHFSMPLPLHCYWYCFIQHLEEI